MRRKANNVSRQTRSQRLPKPEFSLMGVIVGVAVGEVLALGIEVAARNLNMLIMLAGGIVGLVVGSVVEVGRFCWRKHQWRQGHSVTSESI